MSDEYNLIVSFPDQSETFTLGFEAGMIWQRMQHGERFFSSVVHEQNEEVVRRMARASNLNPVVTHTSVPGWVQFDLEPIYVLRHQTPPELSLIQGGLKAEDEY